MSTDKDAAGYTILHMPENERPRERLFQHGPEAISSAELIAIILGSGTKGCSVLQIAQELLVRFKTLQNFAEASIEELQQVKGLGKAKAIQLKAALNLGLRASRQSADQKFKIINPVHAYNYIKDDLEYEKREQILVILQDSKGFVMSHHIVAIGSLSQALVHPRDVFHPAIRHKANSIVLVHNHPSGDPTPSAEDLKITRSLIEAGRLVDIPINDHLVIGQGRYVSLRQDFKYLWKE
jgi:DNA repair protein RadC